MVTRMITPILALRFEANTEARLEEIKVMFRGKLRQIDPRIELNF